MVLALDELQNTVLARSTRAPVCPDCWADMQHESDEGDRSVGRRDSRRHRCTRCGAAWERNSAGWMFPLHAA